MRKIVNTRFDIEMHDYFEKFVVSLFKKDDEQRD